MSDDDSNLPGIDLSSLPEPMRTLLSNQLAKMPAPLRDKLLREGSPLLDRMIAKASERAGGTASLPASAAQSARIDVDTQTRGNARMAKNDLASGDRVPTVMPGDSRGHATWLIAAAIVLVGALWYAARG